MAAEKVICIFCGGMAVINKQKDPKVVSCPQCKRETDLDTYQDMFDKWLDDIRKKK